MHHKLVASLALCSLCLALPSPWDHDGDTDSASPDSKLQDLKYTATALRSGSPVHLLPLNAISGRIYVGGKPTTATCPSDCDERRGEPCPSDHDEKWDERGHSDCDEKCSQPCPPGDVTVFNGACELASADPHFHDGQTLWYTPDGVVGYDNGVPRPAGATDCPWFLVASGTSAFQATLQSTPGAVGFIACQTSTAGVWELFRSATGSDQRPGQTLCYGVDLVALQWNQTEFGAWMYT